jgi:hypothetical protein
MAERDGELSNWDREGWGLAQGAERWDESGWERRVERGTVEVSPTTEYSQASSATRKFLSRLRWWGAVTFGKEMSGRWPLHDCDPQIMPLGGNLGRGPA